MIRLLPILMLTLPLLSGCQGGIFDLGGLLGEYHEPEKGDTYRGLLGDVKVYDGEDWVPEEEYEEGKAKGPQKGATATKIFDIGGWMLAGGILLILAKVVLRGLAPGVGTIIPKLLIPALILGGIGAMMAGEIISQHPWIRWAILAAIAAWGAVEIVGRKKINRWMGNAIEEIRKNAA